MLVRGSLGAAGTDQFLGFVEGLLATNLLEASQRMNVSSELQSEFNICIKLCGPAYNIGFISLHRMMGVTWAPFLKLAARIHKVNEANINFRSKARMELMTKMAVRV